MTRVITDIKPGKTKTGTNLPIPFGGVKARPGWVYWPPKEPYGKAGPWASIASEEWGTEIGSYDVGDPVYQGQPVPEGLLYMVGKKTAQSRCKLTAPRNKINKKIYQRVLRADDVCAFLMAVFQAGFNDGQLFEKDRAAQWTGTKRNENECARKRAIAARLDTWVKQNLLSNEPSFPRKKSKTGVTRQGRKRRGPG